MSNKDQTKTKTESTPKTESWVDLNPMDYWHTDKAEFERQCKKLQEIRKKHMELMYSNYANK